MSTSSRMMLGRREQGADAKPKKICLLVLYSKT